MFLYLVLSLSMNSNGEVNLPFFFFKDLTQHSYMRDKMVRESKFLAKDMEEGSHAINVRCFSLLQQRKIPSKECFLFQWAG